MHIILNIILIPLYGINGLIISMIASSIAVLFLTIIALKYFSNTPIPIFNMDLAKNAIKSVISGLVMLFVIEVPFVRNLNIFYIIFIGALTYSSLLFVLFKGRNFLRLNKPVENKL